MGVKWKKGRSGEPIAPIIEQTRSISGDGKVSFRGFEIEAALDAMCGAFELSAEVPAAEQRSVMWDAVVRAARGGTVTPGKLLEAVESAQSAYLQRPRSSFVFVSTISLPALGALRLNVGQARVTLSTRLPEKFAKSRAAVVREFQHRLPAEAPGRCWIRVSVTARTRFGAFESALNTIDSLRGIWNLAINRNEWGLIFGNPPPEPVNRILVGPIYTIHDASGVADDKGLWFEPHRVYPGRPRFDRVDIAQLERFRTSVCKTLRRSGYRSYIEDGFRRYCRALDYADYEISLVRLWGVLGYLTGSSDQPARITAARAAFIWERRDLSMQLLLRCADERNRYVHATADIHDTQRLLNVLRHHTEHTLEWHCAMSSSFAKPTHAYAFMDLPAELLELRIQGRLIRRAIKFRYPTERKPKKDAGADQ